MSLIISCEKTTLGEVMLTDTSLGNDLPRWPRVSKHISGLFFFFYSGLSECFDRSLTLSFRLCDMLLQYSEREQVVLALILSALWITHLSGGEIRYTQTEWVRVRITGQVSITLPPPGPTDTWLTAADGGDASHWSFPSDEEEERKHFPHSQWILSGLLIGFLAFQLISGTCKICSLPRC